jgi:hypothetical protein
MESLHQSHHETYRAIVLGRGGIDLLLVRTAGRFVLPTVEIPRCERVAANLTSALKIKYGCEAVCLFSPDKAVLPPPGNTCNYQVLELIRTTTEHKPPAEWLRVNCLSEKEFADPTDYAIAQRSVIKSTGQASAVQEPFVRVGWFRQLQDWAEQTIRPRGLHLTGTFSQLNASPAFSLVRFDTSGPAVWFKAVGEPNLHEFPITLALAKCLPGHVPQVLGTRPEWKGWLALEAKGIDLGQSSDLRDWQTAAESLAKLQLESLHHVGVIIEAGARELTPFYLSAMTRPFFAVMNELMEQQGRTPPPMLTRPELMMLCDRLDESLSVMEKLRLPYTLGHLDPNPGNIFLSQSGITFLDWAEAYIGNPFLSFQYLLEHFRRTVSRDLEATQGILEAYAQHWRSLISPQTLKRTLAFTPLVAAFTYAALDGLWRDPVRRQNQRFASYLRSMTRHMHREANQLNAHIDIKYCQLSSAFAGAHSVPLPAYMSGRSR